MRRWWAAGPLPAATGKDPGEREPDGSAGDGPDRQGQQEVPADTCVEQLLRPGDHGSEEACRACAAQSVAQARSVLAHGRSPRARRHRSTRSTT